MTHHIHHIVLLEKEIQDSGLAQQYCVFHDLKEEPQRVNVFQVFTTLQKNRILIVSVAHGMIRIEHPVPLTAFFCDLYRNSSSRRYLGM